MLKSVKRLTIHRKDVLCLLIWYLSLLCRRLCHMCWYCVTILTISCIKSLPYSVSAAKCLSDKTTKGLWNGSQEMLSIVDKWPWKSIWSDLVRRVIDAAMYWSFSCFVSSHLTHPCTSDALIKQSHDAKHIGALNRRCISLVLSVFSSFWDDART